MAEVRTVKNTQGLQQNVIASTGSAAPCESPPLAWQVPGVRVSGPADLLPSAVPGGTSLQKLGAVDVIVLVSISDPHAPSLK